MRYLLILTMLFCSCGKKGDRGDVGEPGRRGESGRSSNEGFIGVPYPTVTVVVRSETRDPRYFEETVSQRWACRSYRPASEWADWLISVDYYLLDDGSYYSLVDTDFIVDGDHFSKGSQFYGLSVTTQSFDMTFHPERSVLSWHHRGSTDFGVIDCTY